MTLEHDIETINEYTQWKAVRQDTSPEAFVRDRAQQTAYARLTAAIDYLVGFRNHENDFETLTDVELEWLWKNLNGEAD